jgi:DNA-directed RNA polymerase subunit RPC12/RpoP
MALSLDCPRCGKRMTIDFETSTVFCQACGYVRPDEISQMNGENENAGTKNQNRRQQFSLNYIGKVSLGAESAFETGHQLLAKGDKQGALKSFIRATEYQPDFIDAHLWIAKLTPDLKTCQDHLDSVLAYEPNNAEATRLKMVLNGRLTPEQMARTYHENDQRVVQAEGPVRAKTTQLLCPNCGGHLTVNEPAERVECNSCGYSAPHTGPQHVGDDLLTMAMLERKAKPVRWNVGQRLIQCQQCGTEHTVPAGKLSTRCRFCGSTQVILGDALASFEQPDGLVPFRISPESAAESIRKQLDSFGQRVANLFNTNRIQQVTTEGVYLPFWVFDVTVELTTTRTSYLSGFPVTDRSTGADMETDVAICAVKSPPPELAQRLGPYDFSEKIPYEPKWLAKYPAALYSLDFDKASLDARGFVSAAMRRKHERVIENKPMDDRGKQQTEVIRTTSRINNMSFQLLLLPVWIATLIEVDGDVRLALVNGQNGKTVFGKTHRESRDKDN